MRQTGLRIKICSPQLGMSENSSLGGEIYDYQTIKGLTRKGIKVMVYLPKGRHYDKNLKNLKVEYAPFTHIIPPWLYSFIMLPYLFKTYKREKFNILRIHTPRFLGPGALIFHKFYPDVPILVSSVTVDDSKFFYLLEKKVFEVSSGVIVQSQYMKERLVKRFKLFPGKIEVTFGGVLDNLVRPKGKFYDLKPSDNVLLFMGVLIERKNPIFLIEILKELKKKIPNIKLVFIGEGPEKNRLKKTVEENKLEENVVFIDKAYGEEKAFWFSRMDIFILPSFDEGFGLSVTEAMTYAKPVITSDRAAFKEIITSGEDGYTISLQDRKKWVSTIIELLSNRDMAKIIGKSGQKKARKYFNWERTYSLNEKFIKSLII
jgi:teichuronic acid biosynthesis glycosyltransferase TuaC